jgi:hypothetical protein
MTKDLIAKNTVSHHEYLIKSLRDPKEAIAYLRVALEEYEQDGDTEFFLLALRNIAEARGGSISTRKKNSSQPPKFISRSIWQRQSNFSYLGGHYAWPGVSIICRAFARRKSLILILQTASGELQITF